MKRYLCSLLLIAFFVVGCAKKQNALDVNAITDLTTLQDAVVRVSDDFSRGIITVDQAQEMTTQLQEKYVELTDSTQQDIEHRFSSMEKAFETKSVVSYSLPLRARKLGMTEPKGMELNKILSRITSTNDEGYSSTMLVYRGTYDIAMQQAKIIANKANLSVSKEFQRGQSLAQANSMNYVSGLDTDVLTKGIIYTNHELLDTNIDNLLSVSVDQDGTLIIEATKYK